MDKTHGQAVSSSRARRADREDIDATYSGTPRPGRERDRGQTSSRRASQGGTVPRCATAQPAQHRFTGTSASPPPVRRSRLGDSFVSERGGREREGAIPKIKQSWVTTRRRPSVSPAGTRSAMGDATRYVATTEVDGAPVLEKGVPPRIRRLQDSIGPKFLTPAEVRERSYRKECSRTPKSSLSNTVEVQSQASGKRNRATHLGLSTSKNTKPPPEADYHAEHSSVQVYSAVTLESPVRGDDDGPNSTFRAPVQKRSVMIDIKIANRGMDEDNSVLKSISSNVEMILERLLRSRPGEPQITIEPKDTMTHVPLQKRLKERMLLTEEPAAKKRAFLRPPEDACLRKADSSSRLLALPSAVPSVGKQHQGVDKYGQALSKCYEEDDTNIRMSEIQKDTPKDNLSSNGRKKRKSSLKHASKKMSVEHLAGEAAIPDKKKLPAEESTKEKVPVDSSTLVNTVSEVQEYQKGELVEVLHQREKAVTELSSGERQPEKVSKGRRKSKYGDKPKSESKSITDSKKKGEAWDASSVYVKPAPATAPMSEPESTFATKMNKRDHDITKSDKKFKKNKKSKSKGSEKRGTEETEGVKKSKKKRANDKRNKESKTRKRHKETIWETNVPGNLQKKEETGAFEVDKMEKFEPVTEGKVLEDKKRKGAKGQLGKEAECEELKDIEDRVYEDGGSQELNDSEDRVDDKEFTRGKDAREIWSRIFGGESTDKKKHKKRKRRRRSILKGRNVEKNGQGTTAIEPQFLKRRASVVFDREIEELDERKKSKKSKKSNKSKKGKRGMRGKSTINGKELRQAKGMRRKKGTRPKSKMKVVVRQRSNRAACIACVFLSVFCLASVCILLLLYLLYLPLAAVPTETATSTGYTDTTGYTTLTGITGSPPAVSNTTTHTPLTSTTPGSSASPPPVGTTATYTPLTITPPGETTVPTTSPTSSPSVQTTLRTATSTVSAVYVCNTSVCNQEGSYLKSLLSPLTEPCDNFYGYVCDVWNRQNPVSPPSIGSIVSRDTLLQDIWAQQVLGIFQNAPDPDVVVAYELHSSCADRSKAGTAVAQARDMFSKWSIREWPLVPSSWQTLAVIWTFAAELVRDVNLATLAVLTVGINPADLHGSILELDMPHFFLSKAENDSGDVKRLFRAAIKETAKAINTQGTDDFVDKVMAVFRAFGSLPREFRDARRGFDSVPLDSLSTGPQVFLEKLFPAVIGKRYNLEIVLKSPLYFKQLLPNALARLSHGDVLNYMGFVVLMEVAPFFPEGLRDLRGLFARSVFERPVADVRDSPALCFRAVEKLIPGCFSKASWMLLESKNSALTVREWIAQLESIFTRRIRHLAWFDELSTLLVRYRLKRHPVSLFGPNSLPCAPSGPFSTESPLRFYFQVGKHEHDSRRQAIAANGTEFRNHFATSDLNTQAKYDPARMTVHVPMALLNLSVSPKSTMFAFHLSRFAVRFYSGLVRVLSENIYERDAPVSLSTESRQVLKDLLRCLTREIQKATFDGYSSLNLSNLPEALLDQTVALQLSLQAFHELLHVRRIWKLDFRLASLPELSAEQLFFVYYALDNCESTDAVYDANLRDGLPARHRVNLPLKQLDEFSAAFNCRDPSDTTLSRAAACRLFADGRKTGKMAKSRQLSKPIGGLMPMLDH